MDNILFFSRVNMINNVIVSGTPETQHEVHAAIRVFIYNTVDTILYII